MSSSGPSEPQSTDELSPEAAAVISRARRSFMISMGLLILGFTAVAVALVYRTGGEEEMAGGSYDAGVLTVPAGAELISAVPSEGMFAIAYELEGKRHLRLIDAATGAVVRDIDFVTE